VNVNSGHQPSWERLMMWSVVGVISVQVIAGVLPHLVAPLVVLAVVAGVLRLIWWYTRF
jgi:hypothetical protein